MSFEEPKFEEKPEIKKEPIVDIEVNKVTLEYWEKHGLKDEVGDMVFGFEDLVPPGERFSIHTDNFESTGKFIEKAEKSFKKLMAPKEANNLEEKIREVEDNARKVLLNFVFEELEFDPKDPEVIREEKTKEGDRELTIRYFKTNQENLILAYDGIDWWIEIKN